MLYVASWPTSGILTINTRTSRWVSPSDHQYGLERRVTGVHAMQFEPANSQPTNRKIELTKSARSFAEQRAARGPGVDVLIPARIPMLLFSGHSRPCRRGPRHQWHSDRRQMAMAVKLRGSAGLA